MSHNPLHPTRQRNKGASLGDVNLPAMGSVMLTSHPVSARDALLFFRNPLDQPEVATRYGYVKRIEFFSRD